MLLKMRAVPSCLRCRTQVATWTQYARRGLEPTGFCRRFGLGDTGSLGFLHIVLELAELLGSCENMDSLLLLPPNHVPRPAPGEASFSPKGEQGPSLISG